MNTEYLKKADENLPVLLENTVVPCTDTKVLNMGDTIVLDLGNHYVGYFSFCMDYVDIYIDAPVRLSVKFCETQPELSDDFSKYEGWLCTSWLQEEIINVDDPGEYKMPRRYAARYIQITVMHTPKPLTLSDFKFRAVSSADSNSLMPAEITDEEFAQIDKVAVNTLKNCMQRVFEDGPKRDRRLWIGDLRLEALTNYYTFGQLDIVRRCLYLFAATGTNELGFMSSFLFENPVFVPGAANLIDYALLFVATLCDYYQHSQDKETFLDLYAVAKSQMDAVHNILDDDGIVTEQDGWYAFIDWCDGLEKITALHGVYLYVLDMWADVLKEFDPEQSEIYAKRLCTGRENARKCLYNPEKQAFINTRDHDQYSVHATVWMLLGGVLDGEEAKTVLTKVLDAKDCLRPFTPYMWHYVVEAMFKLGMQELATEYIRNFWGGMVKLGADTFFEVFVPGEPDFSPYGGRMVNSMCHAWSCTPSYFIRKYKL